MVLVVSSSLSQSWKDRKDALGVGVSFGTASPITDVKGPKDGSIGRAFVRYYPSDYTGFEAGIGIGLLEAEVKPLSFFSSLIVPVDARLVIQPLKEGKIQPLLFGGVGFVNFNPVDKQHQELPRNAFGEYGHLAAYVPLGGGLQYFISDNTAIELAASYNMLLSDNLDDIKSEGNDAYWSVMVNLFAFVKSTNDDLDGDGLKNDEEKQIGTDPLNPDTDGDGLRDGEEVLTYKTNPLKKDTDDDGLGDKEEIFAYKTDPLNKDSDKDRLTDGEEVLKYSTNPLKADTDGDGLTDGDEVLTYHTNPLKVDTDGDGLGDGDEVLKYKTDPLKVDTDSDGLSDGDEILKHKTDPLKEDTDSGGMADGKEIQAGLNPLDPNDDVPIIKVGERIILEGVNFETGKTTLLPEAQVILDQVAASLTANPTAEVAIHGHTDNVGGAKYNMNLSMGRAVAVKEYLVTKGVDASRITTKGFGFTKPIGDNATPAGRAKNRRIEFMRIK
jgi:outer membrane protein OmpA-like peptidoglycan-associated protein